jgi:hypothetical protein
VGRLFQPCFLCRSASAKHRLSTDRWYYRVFQSAPDLIRLGLNPDEPGDRHYRYCFAEAVRL